MNPHVHRNTLHKSDEAGIAGVMRVGEDDLVTFLKQRRKEQEHGRRSPRSDHNLIGRDGHIVGLEVVPANGLPEFQEAQAVRVMGVSLVQGLAGSLFDTWGCIKVRLSHLQVDDVNALLFHRASPFKDVHDEKGWNLLGSFCDHCVSSLTVETLHVETLYT